MSEHGTLAGRGPLPGGQGPGSAGEGPGSGDGAGGEIHGPAAGATAPGRDSAARHRHQGGAAARRRRLLALAVVLLLGTGFAFGVQAMRRAVANRPQAGRPAPDFTLPRLDGPAVRLGDLRGRVVVLNFWTTWCPPCRDETPALQAFYERYGDRVAYYGINVAEPVDTVRRFVADFGVTYPILLDRAKEVNRLYGVTAYPETWWIDRDGVARVHWIGPMTFEDMQRLYEETAGEPIDPGGSGPVAPGERLFDLAIDGGGGIWAATSAGLWRSGDGGATWQAVEGFQGAEVTGVVWLPAGAGGGAGSGAGEGAGGGAGGDAGGGAGGEPGGDAAARPGAGTSRSGRLFVAGSPFGVRVSDDGGGTWRDLGDGLPGKGVAGIAVSPSGRVQYAWVAGAGLYRREGGGPGGGWQAVPGDWSPALDGARLLVLDDEGRRLVAATAGGVLNSTDGGRTWHEAGLDEPVLDVVALPGAAGEGSRADRAGGGSGTGAAAGAAAGTGDRSLDLLFGGQAGLWRARLTMGTGGGGAGGIGGAGAIAGETALGAPARAWAAVAVSPDGRLWLVAAPNGDVLRSTSGGARWEYVQTGRGGTQRGN